MHPDLAIPQPAEKLEQSNPLYAPLRYQQLEWLLALPVQYHFADVRDDWMSESILKWVKERSLKFQQLRQKLLRDQQKLANKKRKKQEQRKQQKKRRKA